jgi:hypothetical protein
MKSFLVDGTAVIREVLAAAGERPARTSEIREKIDYAIRFAAAMADRMAKDLRPLLPETTSTPNRTAKAAGGTKQLDVNYSTLKLGLALGISLKSVHIRDKGTSNRYTHNMKRNEEELRIEASGYHKRQPYAVMVGVIFLPLDACDDAITGSSSFGSWVQKMHRYAGRQEPDDEIDRFEKIYIALYEPDGSNLRFFDVEVPPPRSGRPPDERTLDYAGFLDAIYHYHLWRTGSQFVWDDGVEAPLDPNDDGEEDADQF